MSEALKQARQSNGFENLKSFLGERGGQAVYDALNEYEILFAQKNVLQEQKSTILDLRRHKNVKV